MKDKVRYAVYAILAAMLLFQGALLAQSHYVLTNHPDSTTHKDFFDEGDTLFMTVYAPDLNYSQMEKMRWEIKKSDYQEFKGHFTNQNDGYFTAAFDLANLTAEGDWEWEAELEDRSGNHVKFKTTFYYKTRTSDSTKEFELEGRIEKLGGDSLVISGYVFWADSNTVVEGHDHMRLTLADLKVGDYVEVKGYQLSDGSYLARKIELKEMESHEARMEYKGMIDSLGTDFLWVNGEQFWVNDQTQIEGKDDQYYSFADLAVGMYVEIKALQQADGSFLAEKIEVKKGNEEEQHEMEFKGIIDSLATNYLIVDGVKFFTDSQTEVYFDHHQAGSLSDLAPGQKVEIKAYVQADGSYLARKIEIEDEQQKASKVSFTGVIDSVGTDFIMVFNYKIFVDAQTEIKDSKHIDLTLADLQKGQLVKVKGYLQADGSVLASKIKLKSFYEEYVEFKGYVDSLGTDWIKVNQVKFSVDSNTVVRDDQHLDITLAQILPGQLVEIKAKRLGDGSWLAVRIEVKIEKAGEMEISANIDSLGADFLVVGGITFQVNDSTKVYDFHGNPILFSELNQGQYVEVKGYLQADGSYLAVKIKLEDDPNMATYSGQLNGLGASKLVVAGREVQVSASTTVLDENYQPVDLNSLTLGTEVTVWALTGTDLTQEAVQVKVGTVASVTAISNEPVVEVPGGFELKQNYPNPFNPATTIPFTIEGNQFQRVSLEVYNLLGQKVKTIYSGILSAGTYRFQWNGTNDYGQAVSSGVYFYKLTVEQTSRVKQMILLR